MRLALCIKRDETPFAVNEAYFSGNRQLVEIGPEFWNQTKTYMVDRDLCETDENLLQLLPYVVVRDLQGRVFRYTRGDGGAESRLHDNYSIGLGGHVDIKPTQPDRLAYLLQREAAREIAEEVGINVDPQALDITHFIVDPTNSVGRVHLGLLIEYTLTTEQSSMITESLEAGNIVDGVMQDLATLQEPTVYPRLENWSAVVLGKLSEDALTEKAAWEELGQKASLDDDAAPDNTYALKA